MGNSINLMNPSQEGYGEIYWRLTRLLVEVSPPIRPIRLGKQWRTSCSWIEHYTATIADTTTSMASGLGPHVHGRMKTKLRPGAWGCSTLRRGLGTALRSLLPVCTHMSYSINVYFVYGIPYNLKYTQHIFPPIQQKRPLII